MRVAQDGDRAALETLFTRYLPRVRRIVAARMGCTLAGFAVEDDVVQESLLDTPPSFTAGNLTSDKP